MNRPSIHYNTTVKLLEEYNKALLLSPYFLLTKSLITLYFSESLLKTLTGKERSIPEYPFLF
jgi:hypothetical protein